jgi:hypothetical protein
MRGNDRVGIEAVVPAPPEGYTPLMCASSNAINATRA